MKTGQKFRQGNINLDRRTVEQEQEVLEGRCTHRPQCRFSDKLTTWTSSSQSHGSCSPFSCSPVEICPKAVPYMFIREVKPYRAMTSFESLASERLFLVNPTIAGQRQLKLLSWGLIRRGKLGRRPCLCTVKKSQWRKASDMVSDQAVLHPDAPHEGCRIATQPPAIMGLVRNSLSEASRR